MTSDAIRPKVLARTLEAFGPASIQLALSKAFPDAPDPAGIPGSSYPGRIRDIFEARGMAIAVLGCYINPVHPDRDELEAAGTLRGAPALRAGFRVPRRGHGNRLAQPRLLVSPGNRGQVTYDRLCASVERLVRTAEVCGSIVGIEPVAGQHTVSSIEKARILMERIDSPALRIIFDP